MGLGATIVGAAQDVLNELSGGLLLWRLTLRLVRGGNWLTLEGVNGRSNAGGVVKVVGRARGNAVLQLRLMLLLKLLLLLLLALRGRDLREAVGLRTGDLVGEIWVSLAGIEGGGDGVRMVQVGRATATVSLDAGVGIYRMRRRQRRERGLLDLCLRLRLWWLWELGLTLASAVKRLVGAERSV